MYRAERAAHSEVLSDNDTVTKQPISRSLSAAGLSLLVAMAGCLVVLLAELDLGTEPHRVGSGQAAR